jgi:hypothetical protein
VYHQHEFNFDAPPLVVSFGGGVDSTAMLVGFHQRRIRPDLIMMADPGSENYGHFDSQAHKTARVDKHRALPFSVDAERGAICSLLPREVLDVCQLRIKPEAFEATAYPSSSRCSG